MPRPVEYRPNEGINFSDIESAPQPEAGTFRDGTLEETPFPNKNERREQKPESSPDLVESYQAFVEALKPHAKVVYYPSNGYDVSPSEAFPDSRVVYVDIDKQAVQTLQKSGFEAKWASAAGPVPGKPKIPEFAIPLQADVLILLNPVIPYEIPAKKLASDGYILCNDYHGTATAVHKDSEFKIQGILRTNPETKKKFLDTENPEQYWEEVDSEEAFKNAPMTWGAVNYTTAASIVEKVTGKTENILEEYKKLVATAQSEAHEKKKKRDEEHPEFAFLDHGTDEAVTYTHNGKMFILNARLPKKKGTVDDIVVFRKEPSK